VSPRLPHSQDSLAARAAVRVSLEGARPVARLLLELREAGAKAHTCPLALAWQLSARH